MTSVAPPTAPLPQVPASTGPVTVTTDAKALQSLAQGALIEATAMARAAKGAVEIQTETGTLTLKVQPPGQLPPIPEGARLLLQADGRGGLTLTAVNGRSLMAGAGPAAGAPAMGGLLQPNPAGLPIVTGQAGGAVQTPVLGAGNAAVQTAGLSPQMPAAPGPLGLTAIVLKPAVLPGTIATGTPPVPGSGGLAPDMAAGTRLTVRIAGIEAPVPGTPGQISNIPANPAAGAAQTQAAAQAAVKAGAPTMPGPPSLPGALPQPGAPAQTTAPTILTGTVTTHPPGGQAVVSTPIGAVALPSPGALEPGTRLRLEVVDRPLPPPAAQPAAAAKPEGLTAQGWPNLTQTMDALATTDRQALDSMMRMMPQAGPRLAAGIAAFTGAMRSGDVKAIFGEQQNRALDKAGRRDLAERLKGDLSALSDDAGRPAGGGEWRAHTMPFIHGGEIDPIRLYVRGADADEQKKAGEKGADQRFVLDFHLTNLGRLQMDGWVRREEKQFDLIIRSDQPLPQQMRMDIMAIFTDAAELVGTKGSVAFQSGGRWVEIPDDPPPPTRVEA